MFIPYDYQLDYLDALHLFYYAFPPPVKTTYYSLSNKQEIAEATETTKSYYTHPLDDTSIAKYAKIEQLPVYFSTQAEPKTNQATDVGNYFNQQEFFVVIPAIFGLEPELDDMIVFSSTNVNRLFRITNIEVVNLFESSPIRSFKIQLSIDKYKPDIMVLDNRVDSHYKFSFDYYKIFSIDDYNYLYTKLFPLLQLNLLRLDQKTSVEYVNVFLSYLYKKFKLTFDIMINKHNFEKMELLLDYTKYDYSILFEIPYGVQKIPEVNSSDLLNIQNLINNLNQNIEYTEYLSNFSSDYINHTIQPQYEQEISIPLDRIIINFYVFKEINKLLGVNDDL